MPADHNPSKKEKDVNSVADNTRADAGKSLSERFIYETAEGLTVYQEGIPSRFVDADLTGCTIDNSEAEGEPIEFSGLFD